MMGLDLVRSLVRQFAESDDDQDLIEAYHDLLDLGQSVVVVLAEIVADECSDLRAAAATLLEGFSPILDSRPALSALRQAVESGDDWLRLLACGAIWTIDRTAAVAQVLSELLHSPDNRVRRLAGINLDALYHPRS